MNIPEALADTVHKTKAWIEEAARAGHIDEAMLRARLAEVDAVEQKFRREIPEEVREIIETPWPFQSMLLAVHSMFWRVVRTGGPSFFLTSDNPASFFEGIGLEHPECELILPLSTDMLLHCSWRPGGPLVPKDVAQRLVKEFNRRTAYSAERFVFYHKDEVWIASVLDTTFEQLNRVHLD